MNFPPLTATDDLAKLTLLRRHLEKPVSRFQPGVLIKYGRDREEEVRVLKFIHWKLSIRTPRALYHPPYRPATHLFTKQLAYGTFSWRSFPA